MTHRHLALSLGLAWLILAAGQAQAQAAQCADRERVVAYLASKFGETRQVIGIAANNAVMEIFASTDTGTWTITMTSPGGQTCFFASGEGYEGAGAETPAGSPA